jgi:hypothetical protein
MIYDLRLMILGALASMLVAVNAEEAPAPVEFPKLDKFETLWKRSIFTTKDLPSPDAPTGPNFADNLSLSGIYEIDGGVVAVLVDRVTSQVMEARIGSENEMGIKIRQLTPGATVDKSRVQLQKGDQAGWVSFADPAATQPAEVIQKAVIPTQAPSVRSQTPPAMNRRQPITPNPILPPPPPNLGKSEVPLPPP